MLSTRDYALHNTHEKKKKDFMNPLLFFLNNVVVIATLEPVLCLLSFHSP